MKKYIYICLISIFGYQTQAQVYNYTDLGILFSSDNNTGTSRFTGLNGAMGAVGGDLSSINVNPAGIAVYNNGEVNLTLGSYNYKNNTKYYNKELSNQYSNFNTDQIGVVFVFKDAVQIDDWSKISFAINYQKTTDFQTQNSFSGNSGLASFIAHPNHPDYNENPNLDNSPIFDEAINQTFYNYIEGRASKVNFALAGQYGKDFYAGISLNIHNINFNQSTVLDELSTDEFGNELDIRVTETTNENADGFSVNFGIIYKPSQAIRVGLSYESPTWYSIAEDFSLRESIAGTSIENPNTNEDIILAATDFNESSIFDYELRTPSKTKVSGAFVLGKIGFINLDYYYKSYNNLNLSQPNDDPSNLNIDSFQQDNQYFTDVIQNTHNVNIGGELRFKNMSFRGGLGYEQSPYKSDLDPRETDVLKLGDLYSGSLGVGFRSGASKIDLAYRRTEQQNEYDFNDINQDIANIESAIIKNKNSRIVATYTYSF